MFSFIHLKSFHIFFPLAIGFVFLVVGGFWAWSSFAEADYFLVLHFIDGKVDFLGTKENVFAILGIGFLIFFMNTFLAYFIKKRNDFAAYVLAYFTALLSLLIFIDIAAIIAVN